MTGYTSLLKKTGQTAQYSGYLDDGYYQAGESHSFTLLSTGQYSGTTAIIMPDLATDTHSNNCVLDNKTGLMFTSTRSNSVGPDFGKGRIGLFSWETDVDGNGPFPYCAAANLATLAGHNDWRIPNVIELLSMYDFYAQNFYSPFDFGAFPLWSSSSFFSGVLYVYMIGQGASTIVIEASTTFLPVVLVRGNPAAPAAGGNSLIGGMVT